VFLTKIHICIAHLSLDKRTRKILAESPIGERNQEAIVHLLNRADFDVVSPILGSVNKNPNGEKRQL
jgi:hypothetical protein